jgi:hypothetical protein
MRIDRAELWCRGWQHVQYATLVGIIFRVLQHPRQRFVDIPTSVHDKSSGSREAKRDERTDVDVVAM